MFDYLTKTSIINLKEFTVDNVNYLGWELNLFSSLQKYSLQTLNEHKPVRQP